MSTDRTTEILNYLSAISREVGALRAEMKSRFEEVNGRFEEVNGHFEEVNGRFEKVDGRFDRLEAEMRAGFEAVRTDIRRLGRKIDVMNQDLIDLRGDQRDLEQRMDALERKQG